MGRQLAALRAQMQQTDWGRSLLERLPFGLGGETGSSGASTGPGGGGLGPVIPRLAGVVASALWSVLGLLGTVGVVLVAALYVAAAPAQYVHGFAHLLPMARRPETRRVMDRVGHDLWGWLVGQFIDMLVVGALCGVGLLLLGVPVASGLLLALMDRLSGRPPRIALLDIVFSLQAPRVPPGHQA